MSSLSLNNYDPSHSLKFTSASLVTRLTCWDVTDGEQADPGVAVHRPLLRLTVGLTAVVHEARVVSFWTSIDDSILKKEKGGVGFLIFSYFYFDH